MKNFDQCNLCLATLKNPVSCSQGHLFCRECILSSLLDQKRDAASLQITLERLENEHKEERLRVRQEAMRKVQQDFERIQSGSRRSHDRGRQESESPAPHSKLRRKFPHHSLIAARPRPLTITRFPEWYAERSSCSYCSTDRAGYCRCNGQSGSTARTIQARQDSCLLAAKFDAISGYQD